MKSYRRRKSRTELHAKQGKVGSKTVRVVPAVRVAICTREHGHLSGKTYTGTPEEVAFGVISFNFLFTGFASLLQQERIAFGMKKSREHTVPAPVPALWVCGPGPGPCLGSWDLAAQATLCLLFEAEGPSKAVFSHTVVCAVARAWVAREGEAAMLPPGGQSACSMDEFPLFLKEDAA